MQTDPMQPHAVLDLWFEELTAKQHFIKDTALDEPIRARFGDTLEAAAQELFAWRTTAEGRQAEIIVLEQFSRNVDRNTQHATRRAPLRRTRWRLWPAGKTAACHRAARVCLRALVHSESALVHTQAIALFSQLGIKNSLDFELRHKALIDRFSPPHRNAILGRSSTAEELTFLSEPGYSF